MTILGRIFPVSHGLIIKSILLFYNCFSTLFLILKSVQMWPIFPNTAPNFFQIYFFQILQAMGSEVERIPETCTIKHTNNFHIKTNPFNLITVAHNF